MHSQTTKKPHPAEVAACENTHPHFTAVSHSVTESFRQAMQSAGIIYDGAIIADGLLHRFYIPGQRHGSLNGAYILHSDGRPAGWFQDFKTGVTQKWRWRGSGEVSRMSRSASLAAQEKREAETLEKNAMAARKAVFIWDKSELVAKQSVHAYLLKKGIQPFGVRLYRDALVIDIRDEANRLVNLQFIDSAGNKRFLSGGRKRGCFHVIGDFSDKILICEGFATGASLYEATKQRVVVAFDAGNLLPVAKNIKELAPDADIIVCGDHDESGTGQGKARQAALAIGAKILLPKTAGTDWNDVICGGVHG